MRGRRQSIAAPPSSASVNPKVRPGKRSQSLAPSEHIRLAPRKSILKVQGDDTADSTGTFGTVRDDTSRMSLARRVSFAPDIQVRVFLEQNTNSSGAPSSSPASSPAQPSDGPSGRPVPRFNDENDYPGRYAGPSRPRESLTMSDGNEMSMSICDDDDSMYAGNVGGMLQDVRQDMDQDQDEENEGYSSEQDMEITEAIALNIKRKASLSGKRASDVMSRRRSSIRPLAAAPLTGSSAHNSSQPNAADESTEAMEFTVPLSHSLREPEPPSEAWLALQEVAGTTETQDGQDEDEMELTNAISRLTKARESFHFYRTEDPAQEQAGSEEHANDEYNDPREDTFSTDSSFGEQSDHGERTVNITGILNSMNASQDAESIMDITTNDNNFQIPEHPSPPAPPEPSVPHITEPVSAPLEIPQENAKESQPSPAASDRVFFLPSTSLSAKPTPSSIPRPIGVFARPESESESASPRPPSRSPERATSPLNTKKRSSLPATSEDPASPSDPEPRPETPFQPPSKRQALDGGSKPRTPARRVSVPFNSSIPTLSSPSKRAPRISITAPDDGTPRAQRVSLSPMRILPEPPNEEDLQEPEPEEMVDEGPLISIEEFLMMTGVKFMDELSIPRRSMAQATLSRSQMRGDGKPSIADFITALYIDIPQYELCAWVIKDLETWIEGSKKIFAQAEEEAAKIAPLLFREFSTADDMGRDALLHQLKLIKANTQGLAKSKWYEWRTEWVQTLLKQAEEGQERVQSDIASLKDYTTRAQEVVPSLKQLRDQVLAELEQEQKEVAEVEESDPAYLEELKATISDQDIALSSFRADIAENNAKVQRLQDLLTDLESQKADNLQATEDAQRRIQLHKNSTRAEVFRLKDELESMQALHSWRASRIEPDYLEFVYDSRFVVGMQCTRFNPIAKSFTVKSYESRKKARSPQFPALQEYMIAEATHLANAPANPSAKEVVSALQDFWVSCEQLQAQMVYLNVRYPLTLRTLTSESGRNTGIDATASILFYKARSKVHVTFKFDAETILSWPSSIHRVTCLTKTAYGPTDATAVRDIVMERLSQATVEDNDGCFLDGCVEATTRLG